MILVRPLLFRNLLVYPVLLGIQQLFEHLITAIILRKDIIEKENELKKRDSVFLDSISTPSWSNPPVEAGYKSSGSWNCC